MVSGWRSRPIERRTMKLATKIITIPTILAIAAVLGIWLQTNPSPGDHYVLSATWFPSVMPKNNQVSIVVSVNGMPSRPILRHLSPWGDTMFAQPGSVVTVTAVSNHESTELLDCMIMRNNRSIGAGAHDKINGPGTVTCQS